MEIFAVKWNIVSEIINVLLNGIFAELDGSNGIKNITSQYIDILNWLSGLQVEMIKLSRKIMTESTKKLYQ